jgi:uncharacterized phage protein (TIGR01671 family)
MREILFRGKQADNSEWIVGSLLQDDDGKTYIVGYEHRGGIDGMIDAELILWEVVPETVGQYTELPDKNSRKIFEGDIVKCTDTNVDCVFTAVVLFGNPNGEYNWGFQLMRISGSTANTDILLWVEMEEAGAFIEVIGNIYDNPELIGGETNERRRNLEQM